MGSFLVPYDVVCLGDFCARTVVSRDQAIDVVLYLSISTYWSWTDSYLWMCCLFGWIKQRSYQLRIFRFAEMVKTLRRFLLFLRIRGVTAEASFYDDSASSLSLVSLAREKLVNALEKPRAHAPLLNA